MPANTTQRAAKNSRKSIISTPIQDRPLMIHPVCRGAWPVRFRYVTLRLKLPSYSRLFPRGFCTRKAGDPQAAIYLGERYDLAFLKRARSLWTVAGDRQSARSSVIHNRHAVYYAQLPERFLSKPERSG